VKMHLKCKFPLKQILCALGLILVISSFQPLSAQSSPIADRLPPGTIFYAQWRGKAFLVDADKQNHLLQLLEDPEFTPLLQLAAKNLQQNGAKQSAGVKTPELADIVSLLDNAAVVGVIANPTPAEKPASGAASSPVAVFFVYDATGKKELIQKLRATARSNEATPVSTYNFGDTAVESRTTGKDTSYTAQAANYFLYTNQKFLIEDLITRFRSGASSTSVAQLPEYQSIRKSFDSGAAIEYFFHMPDLAVFIPPDQRDQTGARVLRGLQLDKIHVVAGSLSFSGAATRFQGEILGDTSTGSLFDVAGPSKATFSTLSLTGKNSHFSVSRLDLVALYTWIRAAIVASTPPEKAANVTAMETMAQGFLGMSISDALGIFTGEIASSSSFTDDGTEQQMFAATIQKPADLLRIVRLVGATKIVADNSAGDTTFLDFAFSYKDPATGQQQKKFYYVAVTSQMLVAAPQKDMLRDAIERLKSTAPATGGIFANPEYLELRARLPEKLSGLSGSDLAQIPWDKILANFMNQIEAGMKSQGQAPADLSWLKSIKPGVASRHLHMSVGGWWKDTDGIHFDSYVQ